MMVISLIITSNKISIRGYYLPLFYSVVLRMISRFRQMVILVKLLLRKPDREQLTLQLMIISPVLTTPH